MKSFTIVCLFALVAVAMSRPDHYTDKYDNMNIEEVLENYRLLESYIKCLLDEGKCTPEGKELKAHIKEALENGCEKCTDAQRDGARRVFKHLINKEPGFWKQLCAKYDPENKYAQKYEKEMAELKE